MGSTLLPIEQTCASSPPHVRLAPGTGKPCKIAAPSRSRRPASRSRGSAPTVQAPASSVASRAAMPTQRRSSSGLTTITSRAARARERSNVVRATPLRSRQLLEARRASRVLVGHGQLSDRHLSLRGSARHGRDARPRLRRRGHARSHGHVGGAVVSPNRRATPSRCRNSHRRTRHAARGCVARLRPARAPARRAGRCRRARAGCTRRRADATAATSAR